MKSFKALMFLTLAATLSCGASGSPTNITTDGYPTTPSQAVLKGVMESLQGIADVYFKKYEGASDYASFNKDFVNRLAWVRPYNYVVCYVGHTQKFVGEQKKDWDEGYVYDNTKKSDPSQVGPRFYVVVGGAGTFTRAKKRGGYANWAWNGYTKPDQDLHSNFLTFVAPPSGKLGEGGGDLD